MEYEIHITVEANDIDTFKKDCEDIHVKPIVIETEKDNVFYNQVMTSSKHDDDYFLMTLNEISDKLKHRGYTILRQKIEIKPQPTKNEHFIYYETHFRLKLPKSFPREILIAISRGQGFHLSKNLFKIGSNYDYQMMTYRTHTDTLEEFKAKIIEMKIILNQHGIEYDKIEIEECILDSNIDIDKTWTK